MADEDSVATKRIIELAQENELLLQDVEEYRKNEDDYIAKITALQKYVVNYKTSQKKVEELTGIIATTEAENASLTAQVEELKEQLKQQEAAAEEVSEKHAAELEAIRVDTDKELAELQSQCMATFETTKASHAAEIQKLKDSLSESSNVETAEQYLTKIGEEIRDVTGGYELYMKNMRNNVSYDGIPWPLSGDISWRALPTPTLIKKAHDAGHPGVVSMVHRILSEKTANLGVFDCADPTIASPVRDIVTTLLDAQLQAAFYYVTLQKVAASSSSNDGGISSSNRSGTASSGAGGSNQGGSIPSTARSGAPGKGLSLWA